MNRRADTPPMTSGHGQFHTDEPDAKQRKAYAGINWDGVRALVDSPQQVLKEQAQWLIPSTLPSRQFLRQEALGQFWVLWADFDTEPQGVAAVAAALAAKGCIGPLVQLEVYSSRSATEAVPKCRAMVPLSQPLCGADWKLAQEVFNDQLERAALQPDRVTERTGQLCYLPNRGALYETRSNRTGALFDPLSSWAHLIAAKRQALADKAAALEVERKAAAERKAARAAQTQANGRPGLIEAFNDAYSVVEILLQAGYAQRGDTFCHPASASGSYSASVKAGRVHSLSSSDPLYTEGAGVGAHDAFGAFTVLMHGGNQPAALKDAGDQWMTIGGEAWNKATQREWGAAQRTQQEQARAGERPPVDRLLPPPEHHAQRPSPAHEPLLAVRGSAFVRSFEAPDPIIEAIPATGRGRLIAITGPTGHGKTTLAAVMQVQIATGSAFAGRDTARGRVMVLCGENPDDYNLHLIATMQDMELEPADLDDILVVPSRFAIDHEFVRLVELIEEFGDLAAVFVDTSAAFFFGNDDNGNVDQYEHASKLRTLTTLPGRPTVFVLCHPIKSATKDTLLPRGGGAFLNEVDANLTAWKDEAGIVSMHWAGKMRGPNFDPIRFELKGVELADYPDHKGRPTPSVVAHYVPDERAEQIHAKEIDDEDRLLVAMQRKPGASLRELAQNCGWTSGLGKPNATRVDRRLKALQSHSLAEQDRKGQWRLTSKGQKEAEALR